MTETSKQKREHMEAMYDLLGIERPQPLFADGEIPTWTGLVNPTCPPEPEPSGQDILQTVRAFKEELAAFDDVPVHVGTVDGEAYFWPQRMVKEMEALWSPRMTRRKA